MAWLGCARGVLAARHACGPLQQLTFGLCLLVFSLRSPPCSAPRRPPPLAQSLAQLRDVAAKWEAQAQDSLAQNERLKDLLEESATWSIPAAPAAPDHSTAAASGGGGAPGDGSSRAAAAAVEAAEALAAAAAAGSPKVGDAAGGSAAGGAGGAAEGGSLAELCRRFERELLLEKARSAQLDVQVRWAGGGGGAAGGGWGGKKCSTVVSRGMVDRHGDWPRSAPCLQGAVHGADACGAEQQPDAGGAAADAGRHRGAAGAGPWLEGTARGAGWWRRQRRRASLSQPDSVLTDRLFAHIRLTAL